MPEKLFEAPLLVNIASTSLGLVGLDKYGLCWVAIPEGQGAGKIIWAPCLRDATDKDAGIRASPLQRPGSMN